MTDTLAKQKNVRV